jgi:hypothetical protein
LRHIVVLLGFIGHSYYRPAGIAREFAEPRKATLGMSFPHLRRAAMPAKDRRPRTQRQLFRFWAGIGPSSGDG